MKVLIIPRVFKFKDELLEDPNEMFTPEDVLDHYSNRYPELLNATVTGPSIHADKKVFEFNTVVGTKG